MWQVKSQSVMAGSFMAFILVTFFAVAGAFGQPETVMRFEIPYGFNVGSKALPAGTYTFKSEESMLRVQSATAAAMALTNIVARLNRPEELIRDGYLIFDKSDSGLTLSEVWIPGKEGVYLRAVAKGHTRFVLAGTAMNPDRSYPGKAAYNLTCAKCHGEKGEGIQAAEKFFNVSIPKLNSANVQAKTDAELKELITQGSQAMPPVEVDEAGFRHRLPQQDVDAVIAYVRTLKQ
jgi:mono/diheme cytochrome c family protein